MSLLLTCWLLLLGTAASAPARAEDDPLPEGAIARLGKVRYPHVGRVTSIAFSPDGNTLVAAAWDGSIWFWDLKTRQEIRHHAGPPALIKRILSPDGRFFASASKDGIIHVHDTVTRRESLRLPGEPAPTCSLAFSQDSKSLASHGAREPLHIWNVSTGQEMRQIPIPRNQGSGPPFSLGRKLLAYVRDRDTITLFDMDTGKNVHQLTKRYSSPTDFAFSPNGKILATVGYHKGIHLWDLTTGRELPGLEAEAMSLGVVFASDGRSVATVGGENEILVWELKTRQERCRFRSPDKNPGVLVYSPDGSLLAQGSDDTTVILWDVTGGSLLKGRAKESPPSAAQMQSLWKDLAQAEAGNAYQAMATLIAAPVSSVPYLETHLPSTSSASSEQISRWAADLDNSRFASRKEAMQELEKLGDFAEPVLRPLLQGKLSLEKRQRVEELLNKLEASPERLRTLRTIEVLERIGTPSALRVLHKLASRKPANSMAAEAQASLSRKR